jgi:hypothetical protein
LRSDRLTGVRLSRVVTETHPYARPPPALRHHRRRAPLPPCVRAVHRPARTLKPCARPPASMHRRVALRTTLRTTAALGSHSHSRRVARVRRALKIRGVGTHSADCSTGNGADDAPMLAARRGGSPCPKERRRGTEEPEHAAASSSRVCAPPADASVEGARALSGKVLILRGSGWARGAAWSTLCARACCRIHSNTGSSRSRSRCASAVARSRARHAPRDTVQPARLAVCVGRCVIVCSANDLRPIIPCYIHDRADRSTLLCANTCSPAHLSAHITVWLRRHAPMCEMLILASCFIADPG